MRELHACPSLASEELLFSRSRSRATTQQLYRDAGTIAPVQSIENLPHAPLAQQMQHLVGPKGFWHGHLGP